MLSANIFRSTSFGLCSAFICIGCGTRDLPLISGPDKITAPRKIELPSNIRPLLAAEPVEEHRIDANSIPVQYQQPQATSTSEAKIVELKQSTEPVSGTIREPLRDSPYAAVEMRQGPPPRSEFVPIELPEAAALPVTAAIPAHSPEAQFYAPQPAATSPELAPHQREAPTANNQASSQPYPKMTSQFPDAAAGVSAAAFSPIPTVHPTVQQPRQSGQTDAMQAATARAMQMANQASMMAQRGMLFSAKTELVKALTLIAQILDIQESTTTHSTALSAGLTALLEARDFAVTDGRETVNVGKIAAAHRTVLPVSLPVGVSPLIAQQHYFAYAQSELAFAGGGLPAASEIMYRLGRLHTAMAAHDTNPVNLHGPQSIVFHQAALESDGANWLAANELGVIYARYGRLTEARQLLVRSVAAHPHREGWHNLAVVHRRLGETDLAQRAETERQLLEGQPNAGAAKDGMIRWVDPKTFVASGEGDVNWPVSVAAKTTTPPTKAKR